MKKTGDEAQRLAIFKRVLKEIENEGIAFRAEITAGGNFRLYFASNDKPAQVRVSSASGDKAEHKVGFERFKVSTKANRYSFIIFAIEHAGNLAVYIFRPSDIADVQSLNLRFTEKSKYEMKRKSKYDSALNNWSVLK